MSMRLKAITTLLVASQLMIFIPVVVSRTSNDIPLATSKLDAWIAFNIQEYRQRMSESKKGQKSPLDPTLVAAEAEVKVIKVRKDGTGDFKTITDALNSIPKGNLKRTVIWIGGGEYWEKIIIDKSKPFITFYGSASDMPSIAFNGTPTATVESDYFMAVNIAFVVRTILSLPLFVTVFMQTLLFCFEFNWTHFYHYLFIFPFPQSTNSHFSLKGIDCTEDWILEYK